MVSTRSRGANPEAAVQTTGAADADTNAQTGDKRSAGSAKVQPASKKAKKDNAIKPVEEGQTTLEETVQGETHSETKDNKAEKEVEAKDEEVEVKGEGEKEEEQDQGRKNAVEATGDAGGKASDDDRKTQQKDTAPSSDYEPKHGTLESGHIHFLYRPKVEMEDAESIDDISKFHILLIPQSGPYSQGHYHRIIEVGKKKLPDPGAKHQVIWGLVGGVGNDKSSLKDTFGASTYETKTRGTRHQGAARPAARGHYILHSPQDKLADSPDHNRQRDFKCLLAYEITTPTHDDFGSVQSELGIEEKGAIVLQVKDPNAENRNNPRAAGIPREKRAQYPDQLQELFAGRRFIPANPPSFLDYSGTELLIITSPHELHDSLGENGETVEADLDKDAGKEAVSVDEAMNELGLSKRDFEEEALEGAWA
ncbi:hypothetical protein IAU60_000882 [Kwoniella sp. DSM 27419]